MDNKKDIYNLWIQYTTKNEECFFREFVERFVLIWKSELPVDFSSPDLCPYWNEVQADNGPHLGRMPDELLPAIGKFIIVARDKCEKETLNESEIKQVAILVDCLLIICRHFENILSVIKYEYKSNLIAILSNCFKQQKAAHPKQVTPALIQLYQSFSLFLEAMYDPYLTWRSFLRNVIADFSKLSYKPHAVHVEIIPFIYDCFMDNNMTKYPELGESLLHILGSVISGSQRNGMRAICPATVSIIMKVASDWESASKLRAAALKCFAMMVIVLQKSSPEERQIDLVTLIQLYCDVIKKLLDTEYFSNKTETFQISNNTRKYKTKNKNNNKENNDDDDDDDENIDDDDDGDMILDVNALSETIANVRSFLSDPPNSNEEIEYAMENSNLIDALIDVPKNIKNWNLNVNNILSSTMRSLAKIVGYSSRLTGQMQSNQKTQKLFTYLKEFGPPNEHFLESCFALAFNLDSNEFILPEVMVELISWTPEMNERQQKHLSNLILKACTTSYSTKLIACQNSIVQAVTLCLKHHQRLSEPCIHNYIKLIEEISKISITAVELQNIFNILCLEEQFPQSSQLLQTLVIISLQSLSSNTICSQYLTIKEPDDGILVNDIKNWSMSGSYGFIFHALLRFEPLAKSKTDSNESGNGNKRRMLLNLRTASGNGFEIFLQESGNIVVATLTQKEYLTSSVAVASLLDGQWHYVTIAVTPPKRPFSYSQINVFVDFSQKLNTTIKVQGINETFVFCSIGLANNPPKPPDPSASHSKTLTKAASQSQTPPPSRGMLPNLLERTLSTNVKNYFTLPLRSQTSFGPNVKNFPLGMEETVFGQQVCMHGDIGAILLSESTTNLKTIFDTGPNFASIFSQDNDIIELTSRFVFCYAPGAIWKGSCYDLIPGGRFKGHVMGQHNRLTKIHDAINSVGGIQAILPILHKLKHQDIDLSLMSKSEDTEEYSGVDVATEMDENIKMGTSGGDLADWEVLAMNSYTEMKMIQSPLASFLCLLRYLSHDHDNNKESILNTETFGIIGMMLQKCPPEIFDVNVLMATHLLMESFQAQKASGINTYDAILESLYSEIIFNFAIWSRMKFQITLGHVQYLSAIIKNDRKFYRKKFGVQFFLDVIRQYYGCPENINPDDAKTIRSTIFAMIRFYLQKDVNIKEINVIIAFLASVKQPHLLIEFLEIMAFNIKSKKCTDQMILLLHEPKTANLLYNFFIDKNYSIEVQEAAIRFISSLLSTSLVQPKYKMTLRLFNYNSENSMFPGFFSYSSSMNLSSTIILHLMDEMLIDTDTDYSGLVFLVSQLNNTDITLKLEIAKRLLQTTFIKPQAALKLSKQTGWQESIARLLIKKPLSHDSNDEEKRKSFGINADVLLEDTDFSTQPDLINFNDRDNLSLNLQISHEDSEQPDSVLLLNEIQAGVSEAANAIESEIKELAESVSGAVVENVNTVFSVIRQTTHDIQDTFESLALGSSTESFHPSSPRLESESSEGSQTSPPTSAKKGDSLESNSGVELSIDGYENNEEQLVYLVTNILFTILWRGVGNDQANCWKERCQVLGCINLLALNNELLASHLTIRLHILEMAVQAALFDLSEHGHQTLINQENASHILRLVYDLVVLGSNEDESKKCSTKLLDGVMALLDALMIFQHDSADDWCDMIRLCLGLLLKCTHHPNPSIVAMATAKLHGILQSRNTKDPNELAYLLYTINKALDNAIEVGNPEEYSFLMPVMKALLEKCRNVFSLDLNLPDLPSTLSGPVFFNDFQMYSTSKKWRNFIEKMVKPLYENYQREVELSLWEPINRDWAECYEACKAASKKRAKLQLESRVLFQQKIITPWRMRQIEETARLNAAALQQRTRSRYIEKKWKIIKRFLYGPRGPWFNGKQKEEHWILSSHENSARMRLKLEPQLYPNKHETAANLRDNAINSSDERQLPEFESTIKNVVVRDFLVDDESQQLEEELRASLEVHPPQDGPIEKSVISQDCELITLMTKVKGRIEVNLTVFTFVDLSPPSLDGSKHDFHFSISKIKEIHLRKYNLRRSALEIFLVDQTSYFLNFTTKTRNKIFTKILSLQPPNILYGSGRSPADLLKASGLTQKWVNREISNFEYLMHLNTIAGRSYNDLSQYPVFPWILADFTSDILDLTDPKSFRDLSKPIGVINPKNEAEVRAKYDSFEDPSGTIPKFHYGTHYSNSAGVLHYLLRVEPFTSLHIELQSGRFDVADRQFHSIPQTWKLLMDNPNDVKELIPEFFYFPEFLKNMNKFDLGHLQITKEKVDDVILPAWANSPEEFIAIHRRALESEYVSRNLHHWIDLIFGYKQRGPEAAKALNVFYYCCYEGAVDLDKITNPIEREAVEGMINNFGQVPSQLMREPHPCRLSQDEIVLKLLRYELRRPNLTHFLDKVASYYCDLSTSKDPIVFLSQPRSPPKSFLQVSPDVLVSISKSCILGCNSWIPYDKDRGFLLEVDATTTNLKNRKKVFGPFHPSLTPNSEMFAVSTDGKLLYAGGIWDNSLRVYNLYKGKVVASVTRHMDIITCLALDNCGSYLVTGSKDCTCIVWSVQNHHYGNVPVNNVPMHALTSQANLQAVTQLNTPNSYAPWPLTTLYGHTAPITSVAIHTELDIVVSGSMDGTVNMYTIQDGQFVRTVRPLGCTEFCVQISFVTISYHGHIAFSALDDASHSVHVYSVNGSSLGSKYVSGRVTGLTTVSDFLIVADDAGDITMSRLNGLKPIFDIPLHVPIQTVVVTPGNTHLLAPLRDGRLAVIGVHIPMANNKKHSVLNV